MTENILVCTAWPYANGHMHIGHLAGAYLPPDIFARYQRLKGNNVLMVSGSDSHGTPITLQADAEGVSPRELFERFHLSFLETFQALGITYDLFTHTDTENHYQVARDIFTACLNNGYLYKHTVSQFYSESEKRFLPDRYIEGTCPHCRFEGARGDQCDNCGKLLEPTELVNPRSKNDGSTPVLRETEHFYLDLPKLSDRILGYLNENSDHWRSNVTTFSRNYVKEGLMGRAITRDIEWGIPLPLEGYADKRLYVWFEAVIGYLSASIEWAKNVGEPEKWKTWWYQPESKTYYFIGKDNIPFHAVIWPAELMAVGQLYETEPTKLLNLPFDVPANEYLNLEGKKLSTSRNWAIWAPDLLDRFDPDTIRFYLTAIAPEGRDTDFTAGDFVRRNNDELVANWGNLVNRVLGFAYKRYEGKVPPIGPDGLNEVDRKILAEVEAGFKTVGDLLDAVKLKTAQEEVLRLSRLANVYISDQAPWKTIKENPAAAGTAVYVTLKVIDNLKVLFAPFLPHTCQKLHVYLGYEGQLFGQQYVQTINENERAHVVLNYDNSQAIGHWQSSQLPAGQSLREPQPLFKKLDPEVAEQEIMQLLGRGV